MRTRISLLKKREAKVATAQVVVPLMYPGMAEHFQAVHREFPGIKIGPLLRNVGHQLDQHLCLCADIVEALVRDGWKVQTYCHAAIAQHSDIKEESEAEFRLKAIGIDPKHVRITSTWDEWPDPEPVTPMKGKDLMAALGFNEP